MVVFKKPATLDKQPATGTVALAPQLIEADGGLIAIVGAKAQRKSIKIDPKASAEVMKLVEQRRQLGVKISHAIRDAARGAGGEMLGDDDSTVVT